MFQKIKRLLYFPAASYFWFFAKIRLKKWNPRVVVITGSSGKTTLLHLVESQLKDKAKYSHEANSSFGVPFDILDIHRKDLTLVEWPTIFILPLINVFKPIPREKIYVVEADCDRPYEGIFLSKLLNPEVTLWTNVSRTHGTNFDRLVKKGEFKKIEEAISYEFGFFAEGTKKLVILNGENQYELDQLGRIRVKVTRISLNKSLEKYRVNLYKTEFSLDRKIYRFSYLLPKEVATSILMCVELIDYLGYKFDSDFPDFRLPPGRNSYFRGIKNITIVDSSYNANFDSMMAVIKMFDQIEAKHKWVVVGDMLELGENEADEHKKLANLISESDFEKIILMGPRVTKYTLPELKRKFPEKKIEHFLGPKEVLDYLKENIKGEEVILFKGARFLEGVIENLLADRSDSQYLARREKVWQIRRKKWGL